jgi:hypothetical protein
MINRNKQKEAVTLAENPAMAHPVDPIYGTPSIEPTAIAYDTWRSRRLVEASTGKILCIKPAYLETLQKDPASASKLLQDGFLKFISYYQYLDLISSGDKPWRPLRVADFTYGYYNVLKENLINDNITIATDSYRRHALTKQQRLQHAQEAVPTEFNINTPGLFGDAPQSFLAVGLIEVPAPITPSSTHSNISNIEIPSNNIESTQTTTTSTQTTTTQESNVASKRKRDDYTPEAGVMPIKKRRVILTSNESTTTDVTLQQPPQLAAESTSTTKAKNTRNLMPAIVNVYKTPGLPIVSPFTAYPFYLPTQASLFAPLTQPVASVPHLQLAERRRSNAEIAQLKQVVVQKMQSRSS